MVPSWDMRVLIRNLSFLFLWLAFAPNLYTQAPIKLRQGQPKPTEITGHSVNLSNGEQHSEVGLEFPLGSGFNAQLEAFYDTYLLTDRLRFSLKIKRFISNNTYIFSGTGIEAVVRDKSQILGLPLGSIPRFSVEGGLGHEVKEGFLIEAKGNFSINKSNIGAFGEPFIPMPKIYTLGGKWKF